MMSLDVVLFKSESSDENDAYSELLKNHGFSATVIPCLEFQFVNSTELKNNLENPDNFSGIIFSSPRSIEAVASVGFPSTKWKEKINFSVGKTTAHLAKLRLDLDTIGEESGGSEKLCCIIISKAEVLCKPLLFPCSNIRKEIISKVLAQNGIAVLETISYQTVCHTDLKHNWLNHIQIQEKLPDILIFFSPSGVQFTEELVKSTYGSSYPKCIAVGPTTAEALVSSSLPLSGTSKRPTSEDVLDVVKNLFNK